MSDHDDDIPPSEEELAASRRLREALEDPSVADPDADLARSLRAAFAPADLPAEVHGAIVDDVPTEAELARAEELRTALDRDPLVTALRAAWSPAALPDAESRAIAEKATRGGGGGKVIRVAFGVFAGTLAIAAGVMLVVGGSRGSELPLARARSTQPLFGEPFKAGDASARIDTIAMARASDFRDNRFARWGVK